MADEAQRGLKDRKLQKYYESMLAMYASEGWANHVADIKEVVEQGNTLAGIDSMETLHFRRGQIDTYMKILAQPDVVKAAYELMLGEENEPSAV